MTDKERRHVGAHYTSERDILKVLGPLFLDGLREEFEAIKADRSGRRPRRLDDLRNRLSTLRFLDPGCGCGNFLVIAYRELRRLEFDILLQQHGRQQALTLDEVNRLSILDVNQFYEIEIKEWPARIAEVALWLMHHQATCRFIRLSGSHSFVYPFATVRTLFVTMLSKCAGMICCSRGLHLHTWELPICQSSLPKRTAKGRSAACE